METHTHKESQDRKKNGARKWGGLAKQVLGGAEMGGRSLTLEASQAVLPLDKPTALTAVQISPEGWVDSGESLSSE